jgi:hypothetical protein
MEQAQGYLNVGVFVVMILTNSIVLLKIKQYVEKFAIFTILSYSLSASVRFVQNLIYLLNDEVDPYDYIIIDYVVKLTVLTNLVIMYVVIFEI